MTFYVDNSFVIPPSVVPTNISHGGIFDYNDSATAITPISVTGGGADIILTNDTLGSFTNVLYAPSGVTSVWNSTTNKFDWTQLKLGDSVSIRLDVTVNFVAPNASLEVDLFNAVGAGEYPIPFVRNTYKTSGVKLLNRFNGIYMGDTNTLNNPSEFRLRSDTDCTVVVNGWYIEIVRRG